MAWPRRAWAVVALASLLFLPLAPAVGVARQATPESALTTTQTTAIVVFATNDPLRVLGSDGLEHLEYDLIVTNTFADPVSLTSIEVITPDGQPLLRLEGDALQVATQPLLQVGETDGVPANGAVAVVIDVAVPPDQVPDQLTHRIAYELSPDAPLASLIGSLTVEGPELKVDHRESVILSPPMRGEGWLGLGCCAPWSLHRSIRLAVDGAKIAKPEIFAIDWVRERDGRFFAGDGTRNEQWFGYGAEVISASDGVVVAARDGQPEESPNQPTQHVKAPGDYGGNYVTVEIAPAVYAFYAHLQPGSVAVAVGDQVTAGQLIGLLGNSGNSTAPHLHLGLIDTPDPLTAESLPMVFDLYTLSGTLSPEEVGPAFSDSDATVALTGTPQAQENTLPLHLDVVDFGEAGS
jgi:hypothetical protein